MSYIIDVLTNPKFDTWLQFIIFIAIIAIVVCFFLQKAFVIYLSEKLHPKIARKMGSMAGYVILMVTIIIDLLVNYSNNFGQPLNFFYDYLTPIIICIIFIVLYFIAKTQMPLENN